MKKILKISLFVFAVFTLQVSCKKDENKLFFQGGTSPVLTVNSTAPLVLDLVNKDKTAITFSWTNPNYQFNTGISSQDVNYTLQFDTTGANFTNPKLVSRSVSKDLSTSLTVRELNTILLSMDLTENNPHNIEVRIVASLVGSTVPLNSNVVKIVMTPYLDVKYPVPANLYITGAATPLNWQCGCASDGAGTTQKFAKISSTAFQLTITLNGGQSYLLLPVYGSWSAKYGGVAAGNANNVNGDDFQPNGNDLLAPPSTKSYKITVDFKTGKFTVQ